MEEISVDLGNLKIKRLNVVPNENQRTLEFQLHGTIDDLDKDLITKLENKEFKPQTVSGVLHSSKSE